MLSSQWNTSVKVVVCILHQQSIAILSYNNADMGYYNKNNTGYEDFMTKQSIWTTAQPRHEETTAGCCRQPSWCWWRKCMCDTHDNQQWVMCLAGIDDEFSIICPCKKKCEQKQLTSGKCMCFCVCVSIYVWLCASVNETTICQSAKHQMVFSPGENTINQIYYSCIWFLLLCGLLSCSNLNIKPICQPTFLYQSHEAIYQQ